MRASPGTGLALPLVVFFLSSVAFPCVSPADTLEGAARQLAAKISSLLAPPEAIVLEVRNVSSLSAVEAAAIRRALETELQARGVSVAAGQAASAQVRVTLSENLEGYLWVAEIRRREATALVMVTLARSVQPLGRAALALLLQKHLLWDQEQQILDLALLDGASGAKQRMVVLEPGQLSLYERQDDRWALLRAFPIISTEPWPRDLRGQIYLEKKDAGSHEGTAVLPGILCTLKLPRDFARSTCDCERREPTTWLVFAGAQPVSEKSELVPSRNFIKAEPGGANGRLPKPVPFFTAAGLPGEDSSMAIIFAMVDGHIAWLAGDGDSGSFRGWGSDLVSIRTNCGSGWQVLATSPGDWTQMDAIRAYEIQERVAVGVTPVVELSGPVTALGPLGEGAALAVVRNLRTGRYEAYKLSLSCGR